VDAGVRRGEQPFEKESSEETGGPGQEDVAGVPQGLSAVLRGWPRGYLGVEDGLGAQVFGGLRLYVFPVAL
jgi:hypothetical protein